MDTTDRPHFRTGSTTTATATATSELFVCFTSRISSSSSSMKISKSILSPGRAARDGGGGPVSLSSSLSRRLRTNGSLKGGQASPFFSTTGRKRGCTFDNPEPSSPKVTCIGQVRVKTKKKVKQSRSLSKRRSGEVSFRKVEQQSCGDGDDKVCGQQRQECLSQRNQRWVHLPMSICEALREFSCLFPCRSSCSSTSESERERSEKQSVNENGCGAVFARWLVSVNESEGAKRREIELVVGGGDEEEEERDCLRSSRRHVFEDIEVKDDRIELKGQSLQGGEEEAARVSICIPPKNALLLMRCRSDPMKMAALSNSRFSWDAFPQNQHIQEEEEEEEEEGGGIGGEEEEGTVNVEEEEVLEQEIVSEKEITNEVEDKLEIEGDEEKEVEEESSRIMSDEEKPELEMLVLEEEKEGSEEEEVESNMSSFEALLDEDLCPVQDEEEEEEEEEVEEDASVSPSTESDEEPLQESMDKAEAEDENNEETTGDEEETEKQEEKPEPEKHQQTQQLNQQKKEKEVPLLPECLLLMMREPKLSMEVSKETWVCSTDFMRWPPERPRKAAESLKRRLSIDSKPKPEPPPMATMIEQKLVNAVAYEPFVLTRCKSEPMRTAAAKLIPESCFWKNAAAKPHVGAAEVGF